MEAFCEENVRTDTVRIALQPIEDMNPYKIINRHIASILEPLFTSFYKNCVNNDDYVNACRLHLFTTTLIVLEKDVVYPMYCLFKKHSIYATVGFWKELLLDYIASPAHSRNVY